MQLLPPPKPHRVRLCARCARSFGSGFDRAEAARALTLGALMLFALANLCPFMGIDLSGRSRSIHLGSGVEGLAGSDGLLPVALFVLAIAILAPLARILALGVVVWGLRSRAETRPLARLLRLAGWIRPWAMLDVFLVGSLVALTKLGDLAAVTAGTGLYLLGALVVILALMELAVDRRALWQRIMPSPTADAPPRSGWLGCHACGMVQSPAERCIRCAAPLHRRKPDSLHRCAALVATGVILYLPANLYPVLTVISFGRGDPSTILGGVRELARGNDWPLAAIVFIASVAVPLLKLFGLGILILTAHFGAPDHPSGRTRLFRLIDLVGRWSTIDIVVAALLTALVTLGNLARVEPGFGVMAFAGVVFATMLATESFDPRLLWDAAGANDA